MERFIETCVVDGAELLECSDADERGVYSYFMCTQGAHTYRGAWNGLEWGPVDQGDYDEDAA